MNSPPKHNLNGTILGYASIASISGKYPFATTFIPPRFGGADLRRLKAGFTANGHDPRMNLLALFLISFLILSAIAAFCASGYFLSTALAEARPKFPPPFQDEKSSRYAIDTFIWARPVSADARRKYLLSLLCFSWAAGCVMLLVMIHGSLFMIAVFGAVFFVMACTALMRWIKYRAGS